MDEDPPVTKLLADLTMELRRLQREVDPGRGSHRSTRRKLSLFASEVAIPSLILLLKTQIAILALLRRAIRIADGREPQSTGSRPELRRRAEQVGQASLTQLSVALEELQSALEGQPEGERASEIISEAKQLQEQIQDDLSAGDDADLDPASEDVVNIDVESELQSIKDQMDDDDSDDSDDNASDSAPGDADSSDDS